MLSSPIPTDSARSMLRARRESSKDNLGNVGDTYWVAVKELEISCYLEKTLLFTTYTHYANLIEFLNSNPAYSKCRNQIQP